MSISSARSFISLLSEPSVELQQAGVNQLLKIVDDFWFELFGDISRLEGLAEDSSFPGANHASLIVSKIYYHLGELPDALHYALGGLDLLDFTATDLYTKTIVASAIDSYVASRRKGSDDMDARLERIVNDMAKRDLAVGNVRPVIGVGLESNRLDLVKEALAAARNQGTVAEVLSYAVSLTNDLSSTVTFKKAVLAVIINGYNAVIDGTIARNGGDVDAELASFYVGVVQAHVASDDAEGAAAVINELLTHADSVDAELLTYQVAFDMADNATQNYLSRARRALFTLSVAKAVEAARPPAAAEGAPAEDAPAPTPLEIVGEILTGKTSTALYLEFLYRNCKADLAILNQAKKSLEVRNSVTHHALVCSNAIMHAGTTRDTFLRENLEWLGRAANWAKFSATAGLGVIHRGHVKEAMNLLQPYLPGDGGSSGPGAEYSEGGSLYALGLINAGGTGDDGSTVDFLLAQLAGAGASEVLQHGASLGLGCSALASGRRDVYEALKGALYSDSAVAGEAAGISIGLVMLGTGDAGCVQEMLTYAHETKHEKIIRGVAMGLALIQYGRGEDADALIDQLLKDSDPLLRYGAAYMIAMAYAGTSANSAVARLLHVAVSDVDDNVRRAAVTSLGFVLCRHPKKLIAAVSLLSESYNAHVRYGAAAALGVACAGSGSPEALKLLEKLLDDTADYVRQIAFIACSMILIQASPAAEPKSEELRKKLGERVADRREPAIAKMGALLGQGIIDAGGRNTTLSLLTRAGEIRLPGVIGMALFLQHWYWFPMVHMVALALVPTSVVAVNRGLKMPVFSFKSNAPPSRFAYPPDFKPVERKKAEKVTAVLSFGKRTARVQEKDEGREKAKEERLKKAKETRRVAEASKGDGDAMDTADDTAAGDGAATGEPKAATDLSQSNADVAADEEEKKKKEEPAFEILQNPARAVPKQYAVLDFTVDERYSLIAPRGVATGIVVLRDSKPDEPEELIGLKAGADGAEAEGAGADDAANADAAAADSDGELGDDAPEMPEPFEFDADLENADDDKDNNNAGGNGGDSTSDNNAMSTA
jgi:26S proteasome regulatory subunit N2